MKVNGSAVLHASRDEVWRALNDPDVLVRTIPGCERLVETGPDQYDMTVQAGVAAIKGTFAGDVRLHSQREPEAFVMTATGAGAPGTIHADVTVTLTEDGEGATRLDYATDAIVGGMIGGVGQRVLSGAAKKTAAEFFTAVDEVLTGVTPAAEVLAPAAGQPREFVAPAAPAAASSNDFARGVAVGALAALAGAVIGAAIARRAS